MGTIVGRPVYRTESRSGGGILTRENIVSAQHNGNTGHLVSGVTSHSRLVDNSQEVV
ncbi:hypothetical protein CCUG60885_04676 [Mycobacteroides salmoniphilum]|uniref:Uncharacterized protein n=1 Tax=Mycobacteroides salmoniphilum TaxID=404941 RepID=A0A4R8S7R9_9MYCO|nr:hypothetical protein CCUG60885_04676 [Mycobacteroides salmoniphilum]TDZ99995.1 hypothetical protein CCUG60883_04679 [Mycobacteroides salmoniphilum]